MDFADSFATLLDAEFTGLYREDLDALLGFPSDPGLVPLVERFALRELHLAPAVPLFAEKSVGFVAGVQLENGDRVVLKLFHPAQPRTELDACHRILRFLNSSAFPAITPLTDLFAAGDNLVGCFYAFASGECRTGHEPAVRQDLAATLATFTSTVRHVPTDGLPLAPGRHAELWQASHRSFLTLEPAPHLQWIDDVAVSVQRVLKAASFPLMPAHMDWGAKNARFADSSVVVVYDWDSLFQASEAEMVGRAAAQFTAQWQLPGAVVPTPDESLAFVSSYEVAAERRFTADEWSVLRAAGEYLIAQVARFEAASPEPPEDGFLRRLRQLPNCPFLPDYALASSC